MVRITGRPLYQYEGILERMEARKDGAVFNVKARLVLLDIIRQESMACSAYGETLRNIEPFGDAAIEAGSQYGTQKSL